MKRYETIQEALEVEREIRIRVKSAYGRPGLVYTADFTQPWTIENGCIYFFNRDDSAGNGWDLVTVLPLSEIDEINASVGSQPWPSIEEWAFAQLETDNGGADEESMRQWLTEHWFEYPGLNLDNLTIAKYQIISYG
jgi:hypothetical protein